MNKDWKGNSRSAYAALGARNYALHEREQNDYYATDPKSAWLLMNEEKFAPQIWECACGEGHLSKEFERGGYNVISTDLINRGYGDVLDFFATDKMISDSPTDIITNPPYSKAQEFVEHAMELLPEGRKLAMFLKIQFLEGKARREMYKKYPPKVVYVSSSRLRCAMNGDFELYAKQNAMCYCWFVWEKGFHGDPIIKWIN